MDTLEVSPFPYSRWISGLSDSWGNSGRHLTKTLNGCIFALVVSYIIALILRAQPPLIEKLTSVGCWRISPYLVLVGRCLHYLGIGSPTPAPLIRPEHRR